MFIVINFTSDSNKAPTKITAGEAAQVKRTWDTFAGKDVSDNGCPT